MLSLMDYLILALAVATLVGQHALIRRAPNLIRYSAGSLVVLVVIEWLLAQHGGGAFWALPLVAYTVAGLAVALVFAWDGARDVLHIIQTEGVPTWARLVALYRRSQRGGR